MTTATRRPAAKKTAAKSTAPRASSRRATATTDVLAAQFEAFDLDAEPDLPDSMTPLFVLDGVEHLIPTHPSAALAIEYIQRRATTGGEANVWLLGQLLGAEAFAALTSPAGRKKLSGRNLSRLVDLAVGIVLGSLEDETSGPLGRG